jgi:ATP-binding cassette subfamily B protein
MFFSPLLTLVNMLRNISTSLSAAQRVFSVLDESPKIRDAADAVAMQAFAGTIEFRNVEFGYAFDKPVIKNLSLKIFPKEKIGLIGKSGAGKSTIINLLCRLYDVDKGVITIDGVDIRHIRTQDIRKNIGIVLQDTFLFNGTIFDNIAYAKPDATREDVVDAAMAAHAHEFICKKRDAYDSLVGERGVALSGGEKQRIAIARALLLNPAILILDEALSSVDTETECKIQDALENLTKNRTTIAIAHRLSTLQTYDRLFVIENGQCIEFGTPDELFNKKGAFYTMVTMNRKNTHGNAGTFGEGIFS